jgi:hypothetical protein
MGSSIPFAKTTADRQATDPRKSMAERYPSKEQYLAQTREHLAKLVKDGYLLAQDEAAVMKRAEDQWSLVQAEASTQPH